MWTHRTIIVPEAIVAAARAACAGLAGPGGSGMFTTPLSPTGEAPPTHYISSGVLEAPFADLLPLTSVNYADDGTPSIETRPGNVALTAQLVAEAGLPITEAEVSALLSAVAVSAQSAQDALTRRGLRMVVEPEI